MIKHPCAGRTTKVQRAVFEQIATGNNSPLADKRTISRLLREGLIVQITDKILPGRFSVSVKQFEVPTHHHMNWCEWCAHQDETTEI